MSIKRKILIAAIVGITFGVSSCKKYLNVNTNPNVSQTATLKTLLPGAELYVGTGLGVDLQINGGFWAQYWTQSPNASQYRLLEEYAPGQDVAFLTAWSNLYAGAENFYQLGILAEAQKAKQYKAISLLMQAYTFQLLTDGWGDVPFKQALKGAYGKDSLNSHITNPKYDSQRVVYNGILSYIDSANNLINPNDAVLPSADDLIYGGDMAKWQKFAYTLKLRVLLRLSQIDPAGAQAGIVALYAVPGVAFIGTGDDAAIAYGFNTANKSPLYAEESGLGGVQNLVASATCVNAMSSNNDPRLNVFYELGSAGTFVGLPQGDYNSSVTTYSLPSTYVAGDAQTSASAKAPVNLLTSYESLFLQAEVAARGWVTGDDASLFNSAIQANFLYYDKALTATTGSGGAASFTSYMAGGGPWTVYPTTGTLTQKLSFIITQKWFAMCGNQCFEAWCEWRRTGYPNFFTYSKNSLIGNQFPKRFLYPTSESTANANFPGLAPLTSNVWWETL
jgi:hypothetical protein